MKKKKLRSLNDIMLDMEVLLEELTDEDQHGAQFGEVYALIDSWLDIHASHAREEYIDGESPIRYYGPSTNTLRKLKNNWLKINITCNCIRKYTK